MTGWKKLNEMTYLGKEYTRVDGPVKVKGEAKYTYDIQLPGMLYGKILRSPHPHAKIVKIDASKAEALPGVKVVLTDVNSRGEAVFVGDDVAAVAAVSEQTAKDALKLIDVEYEIFPFTVVEEDALKPGAPLVISGKENNLGRKRESKEGNVAQAFREADVVIERTYRLHVQVHTSLETHGCVAKWDGEDITMWDSTQGVHGTCSGLARALDMDESKVHIITHHMGGGFGSKFGPKSYNIICAHLAKKAGVPVKLMLDREEELIAVGNRPSSVQKIKIGAKRDGKLTAFQMKSYGTGGVGGGAGVPQPYIYEFPNYEVMHNDVLINAGPATAMRAPGHPQANFAMESIMDELAEKLNMDPLELRRKNDPNQTRQKEYQIGAEKFGWKNRKPSGSGKGITVRGMGVGAGRWGGGGNKRTKAMVKIYPDGTVELKQGTQDIGVGTRTIAAGVIAEELGLNYKDVKLLIGESDYPWANNSGGSTTAPSVAPSVKLATDKALVELKKVVAEDFGVSADNVQFVQGEFSVKGDSSKKLGWKKACALLEGQPIEVLHQWEEGLSSRGTAGCQFAEVEVDTETGEVKVLRIVAVQDCGLVLNKLTARSQVNGAIIGELGYALLEDRILDPNTGVMVNANLDEYKIPGTMDMPDFDVTFYDESERGVIGLGEPPAIPGNGAIANAVANAIGVRIREFPITPDKVLMAISKKKESKA